MLFVCSNKNLIGRWVLFQFNFFLLLAQPFLCARASASIYVHQIHQHQFICKYRLVGNIVVALTMLIIIMEWHLSAFYHQGEY